MSMSTQVLKNEIIKFKECCYLQVESSNFSVVALAYKILDQTDFEIFTNEFINTLKYPTLRVWEALDTKPLTGNFLKLTCIDLDQAINDLKIVISEHNLTLIKSIYIDPSDRIIIRLYVIE